MEWILFLLCVKSVIASPKILQYDKYGLMREYNKYFANPNEQTQFNFRIYACEFYKRFPMECVRLLYRYQNNRTFRVAFWIAVRNFAWAILGRIKIGKAFLNWEFLTMTDEIREIFLTFCCYNEEKFKEELEMESLLIKIAEKAFLELEFLGMTDYSVEGFGERIATWKFLTKNISFEFSKKMIDYNSLICTFSEIRSIIRNNPQAQDDSMRLGKLCSLLWVYLDRIYSSKCGGIFDLSHLHKIHIISLLLKFGSWNSDFDSYHEFNSGSIRIILVNIYKSESSWLNFINDILREEHPCSYRVKLNVKKEISSFAELSNFIDYDDLMQSPTCIWKVRLLAELERYLGRNAALLNL
jgi:hypothetical protein